MLSSTSLETKMLSQTDGLFLKVKPDCILAFAPLNPQKRFTQLKSRREQQKWHIHSSPTDEHPMDAEKDDFWMVIVKQLRLIMVFKLFLPTMPLHFF